jgi:hypothetical protein
MGSSMRVFYSFVLRQEIDLVERLARELKEFGYQPTIPIRAIRVHGWRERLAEALRKSDVAVVLLTPASLRNEYVMGELWAARVLSQMNRRFVLVPVWYGAGNPPDCVKDLYVANYKGTVISQPKALAREIDGIVRDNIEFELGIPDLKPRVFIGHGHASDWKRVADFVQHNLGLEVEHYHQISPTGKSVPARLQEMLLTASFAIVVMSAEDKQPNKKMRARQNVVHEVGLFQGKLGFERVIILRKRGCETFTNMSGINEVEYDVNKWDSAFAEIRRAMEREGLVTREISKAKRTKRRTVSLPRRPRRAEGLPVILPRGS